MEKNNLPPQLIPQDSPPKFINTPPALDDIGALFSRAFEKFKTRWLRCLIIVLLMVAAVVFPLGVGAALFFVGGALLSPFLVLLIIFLMSWLSLALYKTVLFEDQDVGKALAFDSAKIFAMLLTQVLAILLIGAGLFFFVIPGVVLAVWFTFVPFLIVKENMSGFAALAKSRELCRDQFWWIFLYVIIASAMGQLAGVIPVIGLLLLLVIPAFNILLMNEVYEETKKINPHAPAKADASLKALMSVALVGLMFLTIGTLVLAGKYGEQMVQGIKQGLNQSQSQERLDNSEQSLESEEYSDEYKDSSDEAYGSDVY